MFYEGNCICEILLPELIEHAFDFIDENNISFSEAMKAGKLSDLWAYLHVGLKTLKKQ